MLGLAKQFIYKYVAHRKLDAAAEKVLWDIYEREKNDPGSTDAPYAALFSGLHNVIGPIPEPVAFVLRGGDDDDLWACCLNSTREVADFIIAETGDVYNARSCIRKLRGKERVALIEANPLGFDKSLEYLERRLLVDRPLGAPPLALEPFSRDAVKVLFEANTERRDPVVVQPIGWISDTLHHALMQFAEELRARPPGAVGSVVMTGEFIRNVREALNAKASGDEF